MVKIEQLVVGTLKSNCYLVYSGDSCLIVDPGDDSEFIKDTISKFDLKPLKIIATHGHFDHIMAAIDLKLSFNIPLYISNKDNFLVKNMGRSVKKYLGIEAPPPPTIDGGLSEGDDFVIGNSRFSVIETPGHTPGSVCLYSKNDNVLLCGDLIFEGGAVGRTDFSYSDKVTQDASISKICKLPGNTMVYSGHGNEFLLSAII